MVSRSFRLFSIAGIPIKVDASWFIILILLVWSLATALFPHYSEGYTSSTYWWMGLAGALGLFACIVAHELGHALVAVRHGVHIRGITLFIFGGVAEMEDEPASARTELLVAIAGPLVSIAIAAACAGAGLIGQALHIRNPLTGVLGYLAAINALLVLFNMIPAFPLDGGRVLRSILWSWKKNLKRATRITSRIGSGFGVALIILGVLSFLSGNLIGGVWWFLLGMFLRGAASMSYRQLILRRALEGEPIQRFMNTELITVPPSATIQELIDNYLYRYHHKVYPVTEGDHLAGCIGVEDIKRVPREEWPRHHVEEIMRPCNQESTVSAQTDAMKTLSRMSRTGQSRLLVVDDGQLRGIVTLKDMLRFLALKIELEEGDEGVNLTTGMSV